MARNSSFRSRTLGDRLDRDPLAGYSEAEIERLRAMVVRAVEAAGGDKEVAARVLGLPRAAVIWLLDPSRPKS